MSLARSKNRIEENDQTDAWNQNQNDDDNTQRPPGDWQSPEPDPSIGTENEKSPGETSENPEGDAENEDDGFNEIRVELA